MQFQWTEAAAMLFVIWLSSSNKHFLFYDFNLLFSMCVQFFHSPTVERPSNSKLIENQKVIQLRNIDSIVFTIQVFGSIKRKVIKTDDKG